MGCEDIASPADGRVTGAARVPFLTISSQSASGFLFRLAFPFCLFADSWLSALIQKHSFYTDFAYMNGGKKTAQDCSLALWCTCGLCATRNNDVSIRLSVYPF